MGIDNGFQNLFFPFTQLTSDVFHRSILLFVAFLIRFSTLAFQVLTLCYSFTTFPPFCQGFRPIKL